MNFFFFHLAYPDVIVKDLTPDHEFIVLACDGIWDVMTNDEVVDFVRTRIASRMEPEQVREVPSFYSMTLHPLLCNFLLSHLCPLL